MKIILDECVPRIVKTALPNHDISTVQQMGWGGIKNGKLLRLIALAFDVFVTSDQNLRFQQNLSLLNLSVVVLPSNQVPVVVKLLPSIDNVLGKIGINELVEISL